MDRRQAIKLGLAGTCLGIAATPAQSQPAPQTDNGSGLNVLITLNGASYIYSALGGKDLGDFAGPGFRHHNIQAAHPAPAIAAFEVYFRFDAAPGTRREVVFELGKCWGKANADAYHLLPNAQGIAYHVEIRDGDKLLAHGDVPKHWWFARWRWQSAPRPIVRKPSQLIAAKLVPPYGKKGVPGTIQPVDFSRYAYTEPMSGAGITQHMPQTGGRADIGLFNEIEANWLINPDGLSAEAAMRAWGEAAGSVPWHYRDETTGAPVSLLKHPRFNAEWQANSDSIIGNASAKMIDAHGFNTSGWELDDAHQPSLSYVPAVATGESYFLENLQNQITQCFAGTAYWSTQTTAYMFRGEDRGYAWTLRTLFMTLKATELAEKYGPLPTWLMPSSYYRTLLGNQLEQFTRLFVNNPTHAGTFFSAGPELISIGPWQTEFRNMALNLGVIFGYDEWRPALQWAMKSTIGRVTAFPAYPAGYFVGLCPNKWAQQSKGPDQPGAPLASDYARDWQEVYLNFAKNDKSQWQSGEYDALVKDPAHGGTLSPSQNPDYANNCRSSLALAVYNGLKECEAPLALIDPYIKIQSARSAFMTAV